MATKSTPSLLPACVAVLLRRDLPAKPLVQDVRRSRRTAQRTIDEAEILGEYQPADEIFARAVVCVCARDRRMNHDAIPGRHAKVERPVHDPGVRIDERFVCLGRGRSRYGDQDEIVPYSNAVELFNAAKHPKKHIRQKNGDHTMSNGVHQDEFMKLSVDWYQAHLK